MRSGKFGRRSHAPGKPSDQLGNQKPTASVGNITEGIHTSSVGNITKGNITKGIHTSSVGNKTYFFSRKYHVRNSYFFCRKYHERKSKSTSLVGNKVYSKSTSSVGNKPEGIYTSSVGNITWRQLRLELFRPERKGRYVKDDTAVIRPDNRTPKAAGPHQTGERYEKV